MTARRGGRKCGEIRGILDDATTRWQAEGVDGLHRPRCRIRRRGTLVWMQLSHWLPESQARVSDAVEWIDSRRDLKYSATVGSEIWRLCLRCSELARETLRRSIRQQELKVGGASL